MKKIFTLLVSVTLFASAFAQYKTGGQKDAGYNNGKDGIYNDGRDKKDDRRSNDYNSFTARERDMEIAQINRDYDRQVRDVRSSRYLSRAKKEKMIRKLDVQRSNEIAKVYAKFNARNNRYDDRDQRRH
jgi:hypothetical protein